MTERLYWGEFRDVLDDPGAVTEEVLPYHGMSAGLYDQFSPSGWDEAAYSALAAAHAGTGGVLELGCGTGRILLRLAAEGHEVVGIDRSRAMLDILHARLAQHGAATCARVATVLADAREFDLQRSFGLILFPFLSLGLLTELADRRRVVQQAAAHLAPDGVFAFDYLTVADANAPWLAGHVSRRMLRHGGVDYAARLGVRFYPDLGLLVSNASWVCADAGAGACHYLESKSLQVFEHGDIDALLAQAGLVLLERDVTALDDGVTARVLVRCRRRQVHADPLWHPYMNKTAGTDAAGLTLVEGSGCVVVDSHGRRYLDASGGLWSVQCGLGREPIVAAVAAQLQQLSYGTLFLGRSHLPAQALARRLLGLAMAPLEWVYLTGSGSESVELSLKLARSYFSSRGKPGKKGILFLDRSYHGTFFGSIGVSGSVPDTALFGPALPGLCAVPTPDPASCPAGMTFEAYAGQCAAVVESILEQAADRIAAFIIEPVVASADMIVPPAAYFARIERACRRHDVLLIVDEVATGFGRTGSWFACEQSGLHPDMLLLGKGINSGYLPLGAVLFSARIGACLQAAGAALVHGSTHNGNPACCAAALASIDLLESEGLVERARACGARLHAELDALTGLPGMGPVRGLGLMLSAGLVDEAGQPATPAQAGAVCRAMQDAGVLAYPGHHGVTFCPALVIDADQIAAIAACLAQVLRRFRLAGGALVPHAQGVD
jgi:adenosylmethionine-8-amino-7-oxononanoate aminotransferase/SAM-dependent methyltransferase